MHHTSLETDGDAPEYVCCVLQKANIMQLAIEIGNLCNTTEHSNYLRVVSQVLVSLSFFFFKQYTILLKDI